jgi:hypothetical protein
MLFRVDWHLVINFFYNLTFLSRPFYHKSTFSNTPFELRGKIVDCERVTQLECEASFWKGSNEGIFYWI